MSELRLFAGINDVAHHRQFAASAEGEPVDGSDHRFRHGGHSIPMTEKIPAENAGEFVRLHFFDVSAGGKSASVSYVTKYRGLNNLKKPVRGQ